LRIFPIESKDSIHIVIKLPASKKKAGNKQIINWETKHSKLPQGDGGLPTGSTSYKEKWKTSLSFIFELDFSKLIFTHC
jgi:hypothetical protein